MTDTVHFVFWFISQLELGALDILWMYVNCYHREGCPSFVCHWEIKLHYIAFFNEELY